MKDQNVVILGVGMMTAVGLSAPETAANVRCATMRFNELPWVDKSGEPIHMAEVLEEGLPELEDSLAEDASLFRHVGRLLRLGGLPLLECLKVAQPDNPPPLTLGLPLTAVMGSPDHSHFLDAFSRQVDYVFDRARSSVIATGRSSGLAAIERSRQTIIQGQARFALAGGIDSFRNLELLNNLESEGRLKTPQNLDGFIPGEASAFLLLAAPEAAAAMHLEPLGDLSQVAEGFEHGHLYSQERYLGDGLATTVQKLVMGLAGFEPFREVYSSMNGESHWAKEWGVAHLRNRQAFAESLSMIHPADCFGDVGAASGIVLTALAALDLKNPVSSGPKLVYCSSDHGQRAALALRSFGKN